MAKKINIYLKLFLWIIQMMNHQIHQEIIKNNSNIKYYKMVISVINQI